MFELTGESGEFHCTLPHGDNPIAVVAADYAMITGVRSVHRANGEEMLVLIVGARPLIKVSVDQLYKTWPLALVLSPRQSLWLRVEPKTRDPWREFVFTWKRVMEQAEVAIAQESDG